MTSARYTQPRHSTVPLENRGHALFAANRRQAYVDREGLLEQLDHGEGQSGARMVVVSGASGSGKSALLARWSERWREAHPDGFIIEHYIGSTIVSCDHVELIRRVMEEIRRRYELQEELPSTRTSIEEAFLTWLARVQTETLVLVIDGLDQLDADGQSLSWLPEYLQPQVRLVVSAADGEVLQKLRARGLAELRVEPLTRTDRFEIVRRHMSASQRALNAGQLERVTSSGQSANPLFLRTSLEEIRRFHGDDRLDERIDYYLAAPGLDSLFQRVLERLEQEHGEDTVRTTLSLLWASRQGLTVAELTQICHVRLGVKALLVSMEMHLLRNEEVLNFSHEFLRSAVRARYVGGDEPAVERRLRRRLAKYFETQPATQRTAEELPWQLLQIGSLAGLRRAILRPDLFPLLASDQNRLQLLRYWSELRQQNPGVVSELSTAAREYADSSDEPAAVEFLEQAGRFLTVVGEYADAQELLRRTLKLRRAYGADPLTLGRTLVAVGELEMNAGDYDGAAAALTEGENLVRTSTGASACEITNARLLLAVLEYQRGAFAEAAARCDALLDAMGRQTEACRQLLPTALGLSGAIRYAMREFAEAGELANRALQVSEQVFGPDHPETVECVNNVGATYVSSGDCAAAVPHFERASSAMASLLGPGHPNVGRALLNLGVALRRSGQASRSVEVHERALEILEAGLPGSDMVARAWSYLSSALQSVGELERAERTILRALEMFDAQIGPDKLETIQTRLDLADILVCRGKHAEALELFRSHLPKKISLLGATDTRVHKSAEKYAELLRTMNRYDPGDALLSQIESPDAQTGVSSETLAR